MISDLAKNTILTLIDSQLTNGELGTSTQAASASDTALISLTTSTVNAITGAVTGKQLVITYNLDSVTGNGNTYTEYGNKFTNGVTTSEVLLDRITFTGVPKNSALEFQVTTVINAP
jgi:hypothetical protein